MKKWFKCGAGLTALVAISSTILPLSALAAQNATIDKSAKAETYFQGIGTNISNATIIANWPTDKLAKVQARIDAMDLPLVRFWSPSDAHKSDVNNLNSADDWTKPQWTKVVSWANFLESVNTKILLTPGDKNTFTTPSAKPAYSTPEWSLELVKQLDRLTYTEGLSNIASVDVANEPSDATAWHSGITNLKNALSANTHGLSTLPIDGPGYYNNTALMNDNYWDSKVSTWSHHLYFGLDTWNYETGGLEGQLRSVNNWLRGKTPIQSLYLTEFGDGRAKAAIPGDSNSNADSQLNIRKHKYGLEVADMSIQAMNGGVKYLSTWMLDESGRYDSSKTGSVKRWGLWEPYELDANMTLRPWFYVHYLLSKYVWANSTVYDVASSDPGVRITAVNKNGTNQWSILILNKTNTVKDINVTITGGGTGNFTRYKYHNNATDVQNNEDYSQYIQDSNGYPSPIATHTGVNMSTGLSIGYSPYSFTVLTGTIQ
ncbi:hypothetical protein [Paenibacillus roseipurpureus]|uniref:Uncharacterized protein n=1 Tax=Paenibacillus roseopurpureus TaxID=2918901 RepID=A0AA96LJF9_9BACL|nr:hypothetical protein [Paenibacillus sp. MBLB1832]WNR42992.1 hypothetical protein MJB10_17955 [Paenibacillus sp. MBLB1832]